MKKHCKWWIIPIVIITVILIAAALLWPTLKVYLAPKTVLTAALTNTYANLEDRFANSPLKLIGSTLDLENGNTVKLNLNTPNDLLGAVQYDMNVELEWNPRRIQSQGQVSTQEKNMDLSVYLDGDFAALSSASLLQGNFYGLTYDTFSQDIRSNQLLALMIGESTLNDWEESILELQSFMSESWEMPSISESDFKNILVGILTLKAEVGQESITVNGTSENYFVISFETTGAEILSGLDYLHTELPIELGAHEEVDISFWLRDDNVVGIEVEAENKELDLFGIADGDLTVQYENNNENLCIRISTQQDSTHYHDTITVTGTESAVIDYTWDINSGDLTLNLTREGEQGSVSANLTGTEDGFCIETADFEALMHLLAGTNDSADSPCTMTVSKGAAIETPVYKNFSEWSLEDLVTLIGGVGSLFGLKIG